MFNRIMVPVDLAHLEPLEKALTVAAELAGHYGADVCYVGVTATTPGEIARTPEEYQEKLTDFAEQQSRKYEFSADVRVYTAADPVAMVDDLLIKAISETGADLLVMGTHLPKKLDAVMPSNGSKVAKHTDVSVFLVRG